MKTVRLAFVGAGGMGQSAHLVNYISDPGCEVVALAEIREELGRKVANATVSRESSPAIVTCWQLTTSNSTGSWLFRPLDCTLISFPTC